MQLVRFLVTSFRSVEDSGWVETDRVTALIGENESGKTNLLVPLWKLKPAREGEIHPTEDYPKKLFGEIRANPGHYHFITAEFETENLAGQLASMTGLPPTDLDAVEVRRFFDGRYEVRFPNYKKVTAASGTSVGSLVAKTLSDVRGFTVLKQEADLPEVIAGTLEALQARVLDETAQVSAAELAEMAAQVRALIPEQPAKTSVIVPRLGQLAEALEQLHAELTSPDPGTVPEVVAAVVDALPGFVYYSNYGNLDSEIYLPHVVQNLTRTDLGQREAAKARTLRVLFKFVQLEPTEILELGRDFKDPNNPAREPTDAEIAAIAEKKRERSILLQSAGAGLTTKFRDWWKQGEYRFRFEADGNHFRIWVSDDRRPEEVELESRSTGLQWFLSFFLVFLVESEGEHRQSVLLLDEPGLSLHPLAQRALSAFFDGLSESNQLLYTTHSPFLVDADRLERARKVYVAEDGTTKATGDLRQGSGDPRQAGAAYAVYSALNLSVAESLLLGCQPVLVEGPSDQHYLTAIKSLLIREGRITPKREIVFPPAGGSKTARVVASILTGRDEILPLVLLDGDEPGRRVTKELQTSLYQEAKERVLSVDSFAALTPAEIEDIFPAQFIAEAVDRTYRSAETLFQDALLPGKPIVDQLESWAAGQGVRLPPEWKVVLARRAKELALARGLAHFDDETVARWVSLFQAIDDGSD